MAKYSDIKGFTVQTVSTDPVASQGAGGTWSSGGDMNTARIASTGTSSSSTNSIIGGGYYLPPTVNRSVTEAYDGSTWSELSDHPVSIVYGNGLGVKTAALIAGIDVSAAPTNSQTWIFDGSSWSAPGASINTMKYFSATGGTTTAGIIAGGNTPSATATTETWNGSSWTETTDLNTGKTNLGGGTGTSTALMAVGGTPATIEVYDGSSWTEIAEMNTSRSNTSKGGIVTAAIVTNGYAGPNYPAQTELYDGTSWTEVGDTPIGIGYASNISSGQPGGQTDAVLAGGQTSTTFSATTLEWSAPAVFSKTTEGQLFFNSTANAFKETIVDLGAGAWASGANINTAREGTAGAGDSAEAALLVGGYTTSSPTVRVANTESWDGSSWTEVNDLNSARYLLASSGTNTAALAYGGNTPPPAVTAVTESWNGSSWTEVNDLNTARQSLAGVGPYTSALAFGGTTPTKVGNTETWDGSSWTETSDLNTARGLQASVGVTQTAALSVSGNFPQANQVEEWDGSSWTEIAEVNTARYNPSGNGSSTIGLIFGGRILGGSPPAAYSALTESWNGTAWTERADLATARGDGASANNISNNSKALYFSGSNPPYVYTEEWTAPLANKTITAS